MEIATIKIANMQDEQCAEKIAAALLQTTGVEKAKVVFSGKRAAVTFDAKLTNIDVLKQVVRDTGFEIKLGHGEDGSCCGGCSG